MEFSYLSSIDGEIAQALTQEYDRQERGVELIPSENLAPLAIMELSGSILTNKYAEGYPGHRYYGGCEYVDVIETLAQSRAKKLFGAAYANVQPHSGSQANMAVLFSLLDIGDSFLAMELSHGGHLTHGHKVSFSGRFFKPSFYGVDKETHRIDYDFVRQIAKKTRPKLIIGGASGYPRIIDFKILKEIADEVGSLLFVDMAHIAGLVAGGVHPSPIPHADIVTSTTHKTLRGPRGGLILSKDSAMEKINKSVFPGIQGGPLMHIIASKALCFKLAMEPSFREYQQQVIKNAKAMAQTLLEQGLTLISGGTDNHLILVDLTHEGITGKEAEKKLELCSITVNKNTIPFDVRSPQETSGIRLGTPFITSRGMKEDACHRIGELIVECIRTKKSEQITTIRKKVEELTKNYPLYPKG